MIDSFHKKDKENELYCLEKPNSFVLNVLSSKKPKDKKLHRINGCARIVLVNIRGEKTSVPKYCSNSLEELEDFANKKLEVNQWEKCELCFKYYF